MGGVSKLVNPSNIKRGVTAGLTGGLSEFARRDPFGGIQNPLGIRNLMGNPSAPDLNSGPGGQDPATLLAQTGGAPVLANIAMGVDAEDALAGYFGKNKQDGSWQEFLGTLNQKDLDAINSTKNQLTNIQQTRELRNKAVQSVINDFPNITKQIAEQRASSGQEFDEVTKGYMKLALDQTAAKYAAGGGLSSGAANEAFARVGAEQGMNKLSYMGDREQAARQDAYTGFNARLGEVNALRDFQNTMLGAGVSQGFSANQANLDRAQKQGLFNADIANQRYLSDQNSQNQMLGAVGGLAGTFLGAKLFGPLGGMAASGNMGQGQRNTATPTVKNSYYDHNFGRSA